MARIRSIKPDFFTSEVIAALPLSARLTFIGLWTHVDDNGVTVDNPKLIAAAIWPLEEDPRETLQRVSGDLTSLSTAGLIHRYEVSGRRFLFVKTWDEHQRVSHPSKPRYPRPDQLEAALPTRGNAADGEPSGESPEDVVSPPEVLVPEKGAGSREQGAGSRDSSARKRATAGTRIPNDFSVTDDMTAWAKSNTADVVIALETEQFRDHWRAKPGKDGEKIDWVAAWRTWMRNAQKWTTERSGRPNLSVVAGRSTGANRHIDTGRADNPFRDGANATYASKVNGSAS